MVGDRREFEFEGPGPERLDKFLVACLPDFSRSRIQAWIKSGLVTVGGQVVRKAGTLLDNSVLVAVEIPAVISDRLTPEDIPLDVVFENSDLILVNKPAGMVVHPAAGHSSGTLVHAALAHSKDLQGVGGVMRPGVVHRLDKGTSGLILLAKNDRAHQHLQEQFKNRQVNKRYQALVEGAPPTPDGRIEAAIARDRHNRQKMAIVPPGRGREAISEYHSRESFDCHTLVEVKPITGRTHQIRLHMAFVKCPVVGDTVYGRRNPSLPVGRIFLHAWQLEILLPGESRLRVFEAPLPVELTSVLDGLRREAN